MVRLAELALISPNSPISPISKVHAAVSGTIAAGAALAVGELVGALLDSGPSLVTAVGTEFIDRFAASLKDLAIAIFGTNDKPALVAGIVVTSLLLGTVLGLAARHRFLVAPIGFAAFGVLGGWSLASDPQGTTSAAFIAAAASVAAGVGAFALLWTLSARGTARAPAGGAPDADLAGAATLPTGLGRRRFVLGAGGMVVASLASTAAARRLRDGNSVEAARLSTRLPQPADTMPPPATQPFDVRGLTPYVTSNRDFYRIDTAIVAPQVDADRWRLEVKGLVDRPLEIGYDELLAMDSVERTVTLQCVSNEVGGDLVGNAVWQGVPLAALLDRAAVQDGASQVVGRSIDGWTAGFPTSAATDGRTALVAYAMNGEPLPVSHGYPARLVVAGLYGYVSATKWLTEIELTTWEDFDGFWVPRGWSKEGPVKTASRIDVPRSGATLATGQQPIAGVAWAPNTGIGGVEVQVDDGPWQVCELGRSASDDTWVQWRLVWDATPGDHTARVRATDGDGETQTSARAEPAPDGSTGWHDRSFTVR